MGTKYHAQDKYQKENIKRVTVKLNRKTDADIIAYLDGVQNKQGLIKELLRKWMFKHGEENV